LNKYNGNNLILNLGDDFHSIHSASLTTKSVHFVQSIISRNLNRTLRKLTLLESP